MKHIATISLSILGIWTIVTGIMDSDIHIFAACALLVTVCIHIWLNIKSFLQHFKGLGWKWWMLIVAVIVAAIATAAID